MPGKPPGICELPALQRMKNDIRLNERFLMERFTYGSLAFTGTAQQKEGYLEYRHVRVRPETYKPVFRVVSLDLECSATGELYSAGLHGSNVEEVLMIGKNGNHRCRFSDSLDRQ